MGENQPKRKYTEEFKREAVRLSNESGKSIEALELGLSRWTLKNWRYELRRKSLAQAQACTNTDSMSMEQAKARIRELERDNRLWQQERKLLKKATAATQ